MMWIIGAGGMLGREMTRQCGLHNIPNVTSDIDVDITSAQALEKFVEECSEPIEWIINCSAYTAVDKAEEEEEKARRINADGVENIGKVAEKIGAKVIHVSTDYVFPGTVDRDLKEEDQTGPVGAYGRTKLEGEDRLTRACDKHIIIRTAWLYGRFGKNFVYTMISLMNDRETIKVINDQLGSPTRADDLAGAVLKIIEGDKNSLSPDIWGVYHYSGGGRCTWYEFALEIYRLGRERGIIASDCDIQPCTTAEFPTPAKRPEYSLLSKEKIKQTFAVSVPFWKDALQDFFDHYNPLEKT